MSSPEMSFYIIYSRCARLAGGRSQGSPRTRPRHRPSRRSRNRSRSSSSSSKQQRGERERKINQGGERGAGCWRPRASRTAATQRTDSSRARRQINDAAWLEPTRRDAFFGVVFRLPSFTKRTHPHNQRITTTTNRNDQAQGWARKKPTKQKMCKDNERRKPSWRPGEIDCTSSPPSRRPQPSRAPPDASPPSSRLLASTLAKLMTREGDRQARVTESQRSSSHSSNRSCEAR